MLTIALAYTLQPQQIIYTIQIAINLHFTFNNLQYK